MNMYNNEHNPPALNIPTSIAWMLGVLVLVHLLVGDLDPPTTAHIRLGLAFIPARYGENGYLIPYNNIAYYTSPLTYMLLHGDWMHLIMNSFWLLAFGSAVAMRIGGWKMLLFTAVCGVAGALTHLFMYPGSMTPVIGASAGISGQAAAGIRIMFGSHNQLGYSDLERKHPVAFAPIASLWETACNSGAWTFIVVYMVINILFGLGVFSFDMGASPIAWEAHIGGFLAGLLLINLFTMNFGPKPGERRNG
jgi:membrane associated rhomboid family serine protease